MNHITFGKQLLESYDLDPLYVILAGTSWSERMMKRFLLAYWIFYSAGVACKVAESKSFYRTMFEMDANHAPRGHERRHLRGQAFIDCVNGLKSFGTPEQVVDAMTVGNDFQTIAKAVQTFRGFGPWMSFKIADMTERVLQKPVDFSNAEIGVYKDPVKGAALIMFGDQNHPITLDELHDVFSSLQHDFRHYKAPPYQDRLINIQELETIACKYKSHVNKHYPLWTDTQEIYHGLEGYGDMADDLRALLQPYYEASLQ